MTVKNGAQEPYPVWHFKNIKERGVWGEVVRASAPLGESLALYPGRCPKRCQCFSCVESTAAQQRAKRICDMAGGIRLLWVTLVIKP